MTIVIEEYNAKSIWQAEHCKYQAVLQWSSHRPSTAQFLLPLTLAHWQDAQNKLVCDKTNYAISCYQKK